MSDPNPRRETLRAAIDLLEFCNTAPHLLDDIARIRGNEASRLREESRPLSTSGGGHADPTASALGRRRETTVVADSVVDAIDDVACRIYTTARELDDTCADSLGKERRPLHDVWRRNDWMPNAISALHSSLGVVDDVWRAQDGEWRAYIDDRVRSISEDATWLRSKCEDTWDSARLESRLRVEPKPLHGCQSCARIPNHKGEPTFEPVALGQYVNYCRWCGDYNGTEGKEPPLEAVRWKIDHGKNPTSKVIAEALTAERAAGKPSRARSLTG